MFIKLPSGTIINTATITLIHDFREKHGYISVFTVAGIVHDMKGADANALMELLPLYQER